MENYKKSNREKSLTFKRKSSFYCRCDMALVMKWKKCPICKKRNSSRKLKNF